MNEPNNQTATNLDLIYKEYVRLSQRMDTIIDGSWNDFKLLSAIGALLAWAPISQSNLFSGQDNGIVMLVGFTGILIIISVIGMRDMIKQSIIQYYLDQLIFYEDDIRIQLNQPDTKSLRCIRNWSDQRYKQHKIIVMLFYSLICLFVLIFPFVTILMIGQFIHAFAYCLAWVISLGFFVAALRQAL